jgi:copper chaperone NosL
MKKVSAIGTMLFLLLGFGLVFAQDDIKRYSSCFYCGMDRAKFAHSRMHLEYDDGSTLGTCSLRCTAVDMALFIDKVPVSMQVGDFNTKKLIDAEKAYWVIGGDKMGVMSKRAKWAFENKKDAEGFISAHGGKLASFEDAIEAAYTDMYKDTRMIREKRKMMREKKMKKDN